MKKILNFVFILRPKLKQSALVSILFFSHSLWASDSALTLAAEKVFDQLQNIGQFPTELKVPPAVSEQPKELVEKLRKLLAEGFVYGNNHTALLRGYCRKVNDCDYTMLVTTGYHKWSGEPHKSEIIKNRVVSGIVKVSAIADNKGRIATVLEVIEPKEILSRFTKEPTHDD